MSNDDPRELRDTQATIREAFFDVESGLLTMNCVAGAGKSMTVHRVAAEDILRRYVAGDRTPEQGVAVLSFNTAEAAAISPAVCEHIREIVAHELIPEATTLTKTDVEYLVTRVRQAPFIGTVDSFLRGIFTDIAGDLGFEETPTVGNAALLARVHTKCYETVADWEADTQYTPAALINLLEPFRTAPRNGPDIPSVTSDADVVFSTIHRMKGDQDGVIVLATPGFKIWDNGPYSQRFITHGDVAALVPPTNVETAPEIELSPFNGGLYTPGQDGPDEQGTFPRDIGLRWATEQWIDGGSGASRKLLGPDHLQSVAAGSRGEAWRLLYVALSRARDHLIIPLPYTLPGTSQPRDRWLDTIYEAFAFSSEQTSTYAIDGPPNTGADGLTIGVNDVDGWATAAGHDTTVPMASAVPPQRDRLQPWIPRFLNPSTAHPLTADLDENVVAHLLEESIHTDTESANEQLPITFETLGPEAVGTCLHAALVTLIEMDVPANEIESWSDPVHAALQHAIQHATPCSLDELPDSERAGLITFFLQSVVADFLESDLWAQLQAAEDVYVDHGLSGLVTAGEVEVELHGEADILIDLGDGEWHLSDLKIVLNDSLAATQPRYELQIAAYEHILQQELGPTATIHTTIETFGCVRESVYGQFPPTVLERRVRNLTESGGSVSSD